MKVYIVNYETQWEGGSTDAVFSTEEKASAYVDTVVAKPPGHRSKNGEYFIEEFEIDVVKA